MNDKKEFVKVKKPKFEVDDVIRREDEDDTRHKITEITYFFRRDTIYYEVQFDSAWGQPGKLSEDKAENYHKVD